MGMASAVNVSNPHATMPLTQDKHGSDHETLKFHVEVFPPSTFQTACYPGLVQLLQLSLLASFCLARDWKRLPCETCKLDSHARCHMCHSMDHHRASNWHDLEGYRRYRPK